MNFLNDFPQIQATTTVKPNNGKTEVVERKLQSDNNEVKKEEYKKDILDIFSEKVVNKNDINDMVQVPRSIFKGYLCFTAGTALNAIAGVMKKGKISAGLIAAGSLSAIYGTYNFVKPFLVRNTETNKLSDEKTEK